MQGKEIFLVAASLVNVLLFSGIVFGWAALNTILVHEGFYSSLCEVKDKNVACPEQVSALNRAFTIASTAVSIFALPAGWYVDAFGPAMSVASAAVLEIVGLVGIANSPRIYDATHGKFDAFLFALVLISIGGSLTMFVGYQKAFLIPERATLLIEATSCFFDASTIIFPIFKIAYDAGVRFSALFWAYAALAGVLYLLFFIAWCINQKALMEVRHVAGEATDESSTTDAGTSGSASAPMGARPLGQQLRSVEFGLIFVYTLVQVPRSNIYMGSVDLVNHDIAERSGQTDALTRVNDIVALVIPFGFLTVPAIEASIHRLGLIGTMQLTTIIGLVYNAMQLIPELYTQLGTVVVFAAWRAFLFSIISAFNADTFGPRTMGRIMGICFLVSGVANLAQAPLIAWSVKTLNNHFTKMLIILLAVAAPLPFFTQMIWFRRRREPQQHPTLSRIPSRVQSHHGTASGCSYNVEVPLALERVVSRRLLTTGSAAPA